MRRHWQARISTALLLTVVVSSMAASPTLAVDPLPTTTDLQVWASNGSTIPLPDEGIQLRAYVDPAHAGTVDFYEDTSGTPTLLGSGTVLQDPVVMSIWRATLVIAGTSAGSHTYRAEYQGTAEWAASTDQVMLDIEKAGSTTSLMTATASLEVPGNLSVSWNVSGPDTGHAMTGTVELRNLTTDELVASGGLSGGALLPITAAGSMTFEAAYSGDDHYEGSFDTADLTATPAQVHARNVGIQYGTFYPVVDGYRDTNRISGIRDEPASIGIAVYNSSGTKVRGLTISRASGSYAFAWNGRSNSGRLVAAGKYKVVQKLADADGAHLTVTNFTTLSHKSLHYSTISITKLGNHPTATGHAGVGKVRLLTDGSARLTGYSSGKAGWAAAGYQFSLPAAVVYKNLKLAVYGSSAAVTGLPTSLRAQNFTRCTYVASTDWNDNCFDTLKQVSYVTAWTSSLAASKYRHRRIVRAAVTTYASAVVWKVRVTVTIGVLK